MLQNLHVRFDDIPVSLHKTLPTYIAIGNAFSHVACVVYRRIPSGYVTISSWGCPTRLSGVAIIRLHGSNLRETLLDYGLDAV